jgi:FkbM family methyltransferase
MVFSLTQLFPELPDVRVVDIGASPIDGEPPYQALLRADKIDLVGFEPNEKQFAALQALDVPRATFLPDAIGDGMEHVLHVCKTPGMTSLLEPDLEVLEHFHGFGEWAQVVERRPVRTRRLDEVPEARGCDYLKIDVQGGELAVLENATEVLANCLVVHIEVQFVPFYKNQPLFAELDQLLRKAGFWLHQFAPIHRRVFKPLLINQDIHAGLSQDLWSDAVYVR